MIIPVRCFTCGKTLADKWNEYVRRCAEIDSAATGGRTSAATTADAARTNNAGERPGPDGKTARGRLLDELGITACCCRVVMMTHVDLSLVI